MRLVKFLSWQEDLRAKAAALARAAASPGLTIDPTPLVRNSRVVTELAELNPAALVLDLDRLASNSREIALMLRSSKSARHIPILFAGTLPADGANTLPEKYARLRSELPDIPYAAWPAAPKALVKLLKTPATGPAVVPPPRTYTTSLAPKLGVLSASAKAQNKPRKIALLAAPDAFAESLGELPSTVSFCARITPGVSLAICFVRTESDLAATLDLLVYHLAEGASAWIVYPKRAANPHSPFSERIVRERGLEVGLVDYKVASIDSHWSALKFARRTPER